MNSGRNKEKKRCPRQNASTLSAVTFWWTVRLFLKGLRKELTEKDLYEPLREHKSEILGNVLEEAWDSEVARARTAARQPSLHRVIFRVFGVEFMCYGVVIAFINVGIRMTQAIALGHLVSCYSPAVPGTAPAPAAPPPPGAAASRDVYVYAGVVVSCSLLVTLLSHPTYLGILHVGMKIRVAVCSLVYRKSLRLSQAAMGRTTVGQMVNLLSNDVSRFDGAVILLHNLWVGPVVTAVAAYFMHAQIGVAAAAGITCILAFVPFQGWLGHTSSVLRLRTAIRTDDRLRLMGEILNGIQVIKMYAWEHAFAAAIADCRRRELAKIRRSSYIRGLIKSFHLATTRTALFVTVLTYLLLGNTISAPKVFMVTACLDVIKQTMTDYFAMAITQAAEFDISIRRVHGFLLLDETLRADVGAAVGAPAEDAAASAAATAATTVATAVATAGAATAVKRSRRGRVSVHDACARWGSAPEAVDDTLSHVQLTVEPGRLVALVGPVGSGKSSLLHVLLRELPLTHGTVDVEGTVSYASQEPWLFAGTVRQNILFGRPMNKERYRAVVSRCSLDKDFKAFPRGDRTVVGERGVSLSGGQRARISLARAIYKKADVYLLDDPLSAVDAHVSTQLFQSCIASYVHDKTRVLVTHQLQYLKHVDEVLVLEGGAVKARGTYHQLRAACDRFSCAQDEHGATAATAGAEDEQKKRLILRRGSVHSTGSLDDERLDQLHGGADEDEQRSSGGIAGAVYRAYVRAAGGACALTGVLLLFLLAQLAASAGDYFVGYWVNREEAHVTRELAARADHPGRPDPSNHSGYNLDEELFTLSFWHPRRQDCVYLYSAVTALTLLITVVRSFVFFSACTHASRRLHDAMFRSVVRAPMLFFNSNPSGRILNRFSRDTGSIDEALPKSLIDCLQIGFSLVGIFVVVALVNPLLLVPTALVLAVFYALRAVYLSTSRSVKRLEGITRSPVFSHMAASLQGLTTIRAFGAAQVLVKEFDLHQDLHSSAWYLLIAISQSFSYYLDLVCVSYVAAVTFILVLQNETYGGNMGLAVTQVMGLMGMLQWGIRQSSEFENQMTSVERVQEYSRLDGEDGADDADSAREGKRDKSRDAAPAPLEDAEQWPRRGGLEFYKVHLRYSPHEPDVLKNLSFCIEPREKIGIVGRTGAGKSSLIAALFRLSQTEGTVLIDGRDTRTLPLRQLRSKISIIPQEPVLFSGTMRSNLDPLGGHTDLELWTALDQVELRGTVADMDGGLDGPVLEAGANLSVGQRQLVCLARAIILDNRILVLDEATANVDPHTDALIQTTIRTKFAECTVLTIAHRLHTVMDSDRVLVMDAGTVAEFQHPHLLLQNPDGLLYQMVQQTGASMAENLARMAEQNFNRSFATDGVEPR